MTDDHRVVRRLATPPPSSQRGQLRAGAQTGELRPFHAALEAWKSTAVIHSDPAVLAQIQRERSSDELDQGESDVAFPPSPARSSSTLR